VALIPEQLPAQRIPTKSTSFTVAVPILETQRFEPKQILNCIQTTSGGNKEKHFLHASSMTGAPHVSLNHPHSTASGLDHFCASTTTGKGIVSIPATTTMQDLKEPDMLPPLKQGPGMVLLVMVQFSTATGKSLSLSVVILLLPASQSTLPTLLPKDALNSEPSLGSSESLSPLLPAQAPAPCKSVQKAEMIPPASYKVPRKTLLSMLTVTMQLLPTCKTPAQVRCYKSSCGAVENSLATPTGSSISNTPIGYHRCPFGSLIVWLEEEHNLFNKLYNPSVGSKLCASQDTLSKTDSHLLLDSSKRQKAEIFEKPETTYTENSPAFESGMYLILLPYYPGQYLVI
jgi:hypothetical protein